MYLYSGLDRPVTCIPVPVYAAAVEALTSQLADMRIGQSVELVADIYGDDVVYKGSVQGLGAGTGAAFALLPAQNATGNWFKVVQRVPVRIQLNGKELDEHPLRIGLSLSATVHTNITDGASLSGVMSTQSIGYGALFGSIVLLPLWLQQWMGYTATWAGMVTAPVGILAIAATPFVGANIARLDARKVVTASFLVFALVMWMRSQFSTDTTPQAILNPIVIQGLALATGRLPVQHIDADVRTLK